VVEHAIQLISCGLADGEAVDRAVAAPAVLDPQTVSHPGGVQISQNFVPHGWAMQADRSICVRANLKTARTPQRQNETARDAVRAGRRTLP